MPGTGYNTFHGPDSGPPPPPFVAGTLPHGKRYVTGTREYQQPIQLGCPVQSPQVVHLMQPQPQNYIVPIYQPPQTIQQAPPVPQHITYVLPNPAVVQQSAPIPVPAMAPTPIVSVIPSGYSYLVPTQTCRIHVVVAQSPPWESNVRGTLPHIKYLVPVSYTVKAAMGLLGCTNADPKKNVLTEIIRGPEGGENYKWYKGLFFTGDQTDRIEKTIAEFGWNESRTGESGSAVVWIYAQKE